MQYGNPNFASTSQRRSPFTDFSAMLNRSSNPGGFGTQQMQGNVVQQPNVPNSLPQAQRPQTTPQAPQAPGYNYTTPLQGGQGFHNAAYQEMVYQALPYFESILGLNRQLGDLYGQDQSDLLRQLLQMTQNARPTSGTYFWSGYS